MAGWSCSGKGLVPSGVVGPGIKSDRYVLIDSRRERWMVVSGGGGGEMREMAHETNSCEIRLLLLILLRSSSFFLARIFSLCWICIMYIRVSVCDFGEYVFLYVVGLARHCVPMNYLPRESFHNNNKNTKDLLIPCTDIGVRISLYL